MVDHDSGYVITQKVCKSGDVNAPMLIIRNELEAHPAGLDQLHDRQHIGGVFRGGNQDAITGAERALMVDGGERLLPGGGRRFE